MFSNRPTGIHLPASGVGRSQLMHPITKSRKKTAKVLDAGFHNPPQGGWLKIDWEEPDPTKKRGTRFVIRYIQCSRVRAAQEMARLARSS